MPACDMSSVKVGAQEILGRKGQYVGALIIRTRFWGPLYYNYDMEPPKIV